jgi:hypothetical protein
MAKILKWAGMSTKTKMLGKCESAQPPENIDDANSFTGYLRNSCVDAGRLPFVSEKENGQSLTRIGGLCHSQLRPASVIYASMMKKPDSLPISAAIIMFNEEETFRAVWKMSAAWLRS